MVKHNMKINSGFLMNSLNSKLVVASEKLLA